MIDADVKLGKNVKIFDKSMVNIFGCEIGDDTFIGPFVEITRGVTIGKKCKIESHSFLCTGVTIEDGVFIGHGVTFVNDHYPSTWRHVEYFPTRICEGASLGSGSTILGGVTVGRASIVGAGAVVTKNVPSYSIAAGNPAKILKQFETEAQLRDYMLRRQESSHAP